MPKPLLERAFRQTYGIELKDVFLNIDLSIGSYRRSISSVIPEMTRVALLLKKDDLVKENPTVSKRKFLYNLKRSDYEREWGKTYQKPGFGARIFAVLFRLMPKVGPFKALKFQMPSPVLVVVDAKDDCALECRRNRRGHGSPSKQFSTLRLRTLFKIAH
ncbi:MAG: hypothetical protein WA188_10985, partial [Terriglobales bacterium]